MQHIGSFPVSSAPILIRMAQGSQSVPSPPPRPPRGGHFVCDKEGSASAVLIRALQPTHGIPAMRRRRGLHDERALCSGPGKLCEALAVTIEHSELPLDRPPIALHARTSQPDVVTGVRIGITKAVDLPWRYGLKDSKFISK